VNIISLASSLATSIVPNITKINIDAVRDLFPYLLSVMRIERIDQVFIKRLAKKAMRLGVWAKLDPFERSLIYVLRDFLKRGYKVVSRELHTIIAKIYAKVEMYSLRGRAILIGIMVKVRSCRELGTLEELLIEGLQFMNRPIPYRVI